MLGRSGVVGMTGVCFVFRLHVAAAGGHADCLSVLLTHGADPSLPDAAGILTVQVLLPVQPGRASLRPCP